MPFISTKTNVTVTKEKETELKQRLGQAIAILPGKSESWLIRKEASLEVLRRAEDPAVLFIWLGDKLSNLRSFRRAKLKLGDGMWKLFNQKDPGMHARYYRSILRALSGLKDTGAWKEYRDLVEELFGAAQDEAPESPGPEDAL